MKIKYLCTKCGTLWNDEDGAKSCCFAQSLMELANDINSIHFPKGITRSASNLRHFYLTRYNCLRRIYLALALANREGFARIVRGKMVEAWRKNRKYTALMSQEEDFIQQKYKGMMEDVEL